MYTVDTSSGSFWRTWLQHTHPTLRLAVILNYFDELLRFLIEYELSTQYLAWKNVDSSLHEGNRVKPAERPELAGIQIPNTRTWPLDTYPGRRYTYPANSEVPLGHGNIADPLYD